MNLNRKHNKEISDDGDDDMVGPEAEGHELDKELLGWTGESIPVDKILAWWSKDKKAASDNLHCNKEYAIDSVQTHEPVDQGAETALGDLERENIDDCWW